jgi:hypothetical protein
MSIVHLYPEDQMEAAIRAANDHGQRQLRTISTGELTQARRPSPIPTPTLNTRKDGGAISIHTRGGQIKQPTVLDQGVEQSVSVAEQMGGGSGPRVKVLFQEGVDKPLTEPKGKSVNGVPSEYSVPADTNIPGGKPVGQGWTATNRTKSVNDLGRVEADHPMPGASEEAWTRLSTDAQRTTSVTPPPQRLINWAQNPQELIDTLRDIPENLVSSALNGGKQGREILGLLRATDNEYDAQFTSRIFGWAFLSRMLSPYPQEAAALDIWANSTMDNLITKAVNGDWTPGISRRVKLDDAGNPVLNKAGKPITESYGTEGSDFALWIKTIEDGLIPVGGPGKQATSNANDLGKFFERTAVKDENGKTVLQKIHDVIISGDDETTIRRRVLELLPHNAGIDNKIVSFVLHQLGFENQMIMDRVQIRNLFAGDILDAGAKSRGSGRGEIYSDVAGMFNGPQGLAIYEGIDRTFLNPRENLGGSSLLAHIWKGAGLKGEPTLSALHWILWNKESAQDVTHGSIEYLIKTFNGVTDDVAQGVSRQGKTADSSYGARYTPGTNSILWDSASGTTYAFDLLEFREFTKHIRQRESGIIPEAWWKRAEALYERDLRRFKDGEIDEKPKRGLWDKGEVNSRIIPGVNKAPWFNLDGIHQRQLDTAALKFSRGVHEVPVVQTVGRVSDDAGGVAGKQRTLFQDERGAVFINQETGEAWIKALTNPDFSTGIHETAHIFRDQLFRRSVSDTGMAGVSDDLLKQVEDAFGVVDGKWTVDAEERFARGFEQWLIDGNSIAGVDDAVTKLIAAKMRSVYSDVVSNGGVVEKLTDEMVAVYQKLLVNRSLPVQYAPGKFMRPLDYTKPLALVKRLEAEGKDWLEEIKPSDLLGTSRMNETGNIRFQEMDEIGEEYLQFAAGLEGLLREIRDSDVVLKNPRTMDMVGEDSLRLLNMWMARNEGDMTKTLREQLDNASLIRPSDQNGAPTMVAAGQMYLRERLINLQELGVTASGSATPQNLVKFHLALAEYEQIAAMVANTRTTFGHYGQALKSGNLPNPEKVAESIASASSTLDELSMGGPIGRELADMIANLKTTGDDLGSVAAIINNTNKNRGMVKNAFDTLYKIYINGLLGLPRTFFGLAALSPGIVLGMRGMEKLLGGTLRALKTGNTDIVEEAFMNGYRNLRESRNVLKYFWDAYKSNDSVLMPAKMWEDSVVSSTRPATTAVDESDNWFRLAYGHVGRFTEDRVTGAPLNIMIAVDDSWRQVTARTASESIVTAEETTKLLKQHGITKPRRSTTGRGSHSAAEEAEIIAKNKEELASRIQNRMDEIIRDGKLQETNDVMKRVANDPAVQAIDDPLDQQFEIVRRGQDWAKRNQNTVDRVSDHARRPTFQYDLGPSGQAFSNVVGAIPALRWLIPFRKTPMNLFREAFSYMLGPTVIAGSEVFGRSHSFLKGKGFVIPPDSWLKKAGSRMWEDITSGDPARVAEARGRQGMAVAYFSAAYWMASEGVFTGAGPDDPAKRRIKEKTGWQPYSIDLRKMPWGDENSGHLSYKKMDPAAMILGMMADVHETLNSDADDGVKHGYASSVLIAVAESLRDNTQARDYLMGINSLMEVYQERKPVDSWVYQLAPTVTTPLSGTQRGWLQSSENEYIRDISSLSDSIAANTFMLSSEDVPPSFDLVGQPRKYSDIVGGGGGWMNFVSPMKYTANNSDTMWLELDALPDSFNYPGTQWEGLNLRNYEDEKGWDAWNHMQDRSGRIKIAGEDGKKRTLSEALRYLFSTDEYKNASDNAIQTPDGKTFTSVKGQMVRSELDMYRQAAMEDEDNGVLSMPEFANLLRDYERINTARDLDSQIGTDKETPEHQSLIDQLQGAIQQ